MFILALCVRKIAPKYASIPGGELNKCREFYEDLLRYITDTDYEKQFSWKITFVSASVLTETSMYELFA